MGVTGPGVASCFGFLFFVQHDLMMMMGERVLVQIKGCLETCGICAPRGYVNYHHTAFCNQERWRIWWRFVSVCWLVNLVRYRPEPVEAM